MEFDGQQAQAGHVCVVPDLVRVRQGRLSWRNYAIAGSKSSTKRLGGLAPSASSTCLELDPLSWAGSLVCLDGLHEQALGAAIERGWRASRMKPAPVPAYTLSGVPRSAGRVGTGVMLETAAEVAETANSHAHVRARTTTSDLGV